MEFLRNLSARHERLKKAIHSTRIPLSATGQKIMGVVYFSIPVVCGYYVMKWAERKAETNFQLEVRCFVVNVRISGCVMVVGVLLLCVCG